MVVEEEVEEVGEGETCWQIVARRLRAMFSPQFFRNNVNNLNQDNQ